MQLRFSIFRVIDNITLGVFPSKFTVRELFKTTERFIFIYNFVSNKIKYTY